MPFDYPTRYVHENPPQDVKDIPEYLNRELRRISEAIEAAADGFQDKIHVEPTKKRDGMVRYADGIDWDPGGGEGFYAYIAGFWVPLSQELIAIFITATSYTASLGDDVILVDDDTAGSTVTINLPPAASVKAEVYNIKKLGTTANVIVDGNGSETIDLGLTALLTVQHEAITIVSDGSNWHIL